MPAFLGVSGRLVAVRASDVPVVRSARGSVVETLSGRRVAQFGRGRDHRVWTISRAALTAVEWNTLELFASGVYGRGPFIWLDPWAAVTNALSVDESLFIGWGGDSWDRVSGVRTIADGYGVETVVPVSLERATPGEASVEGVPVPPGVNRFVVWVEGPGSSEVKVTVDVYDVSDVRVNTVTVTAPTGAGWRRVVVDVPDGGATVAVSIGGAVGVAGPQLVHGTVLPESWVVGQRANVTVGDSSHAPLVTIPGHSYTGLSLTLTEVGVVGDGVLIPAEYQGYGLPPYGL